MRCHELARKCGADATSLRKELGLRAVTQIVTAYDIRDLLELGAIDPDIQDCVPTLARLVGPRSGPYVELDWLRHPDWPWKGYYAKPARIFAQARPHDRTAEAEARDLIELRKRARGVSGLDPTRRRATEAAEIALRAMRAPERSVLLLRLGSRRGSQDAAWATIARELELPSHSLAKEIFKVAVTDFLAEYGRVSGLLVMGEISRNGNRR